MAVLSNIMQIYQSYPWVFDGIIICTLLGVLFRILFEKGKIGEPAQAKKLGGIFGFFMGIAMIGYMQFRGWTLFIDGGPWIFSIIIISLVLVFWAILDGMLKHESRSVTIPLALIVALGLIYAFLNFVPAYMSGVRDIFGPYTWVWHLIIWCLMIFVLFWALVGMMAGGKIPGVLGIGGGIAKGLGDALGGAMDYVGGWRAKRKAAKGARAKPADTPEETKKIDTETDKDLVDAGKEADKTDKALDTAKAISGALAKILNDIRSSANGVRQFPPQFKSANYKSASEWLNKKLGELNTEKKKFDGIQLVAKLINVQEALQVAKSDVDAELQRIGTYTKINELVTKIGQISNDNPEKPQLIADAKAEQDHLATIVAGLQVIIKTFEDAVNEVLKEEHIAQTKAKIEELDNQLTVIQALLPTVIKDIADLAKEPMAEAKKELQTKINANCDKLVTATTLAIEILGTLNKVVIDGMLKQGLKVTEVAITRFIESKRQYIADFVKLQKDVDALLARVNEILSKQATPEEKTALGAELHKIREILLAQIAILQTLITHANSFIGVLTKAWNEIVGTEKGAAIKGVARMKIGEEEASIGFKGERKGKAIEIPAGETEAQKVIIATLARAQEMRKTDADVLKAAAKTELTKAQAAVAGILSKGKGISAQQRKDLEALLGALNDIVHDETELNQWYALFADYEKTVVNIIIERSKLKTKKQRKTIESVVYAFNGLLKNLKTKLDKLKAALAFIEKVEKEITAEISAPTPPSGGVGAPPIPPPPSSSSGVSAPRIPPPPPPGLSS